MEIYKCGSVVFISNDQKKKLKGYFNPENRIKNYHYVYYSEYLILRNNNPVLPDYKDLSLLNPFSVIQTVQSVRAATLEQKLNNPT